MKNIVAALAFIVFNCHLLADDRGAYAGYVKRVDGQGQLCISNAAMTNLIRLNPNEARYQEVFQYDQLWCGPGSTATLMLRWGTLWELASNQWEQVPLDPDPGSIDPRVHAAQRVLEALRPANRSRGGGTLPVFQPANNSTVRLGGTFVVCWVPATIPMQLQLSISSRVSSFTFQTNVDAMLGSIDLPDALLLLKSEQKNENLEFILGSQMDAGPVRNLKFNILSEAEEKKVDSALAEIQSSYATNSAEFHLTRASVLNEFNLYNDAEKEYDQALNSTGNQESITLLNRLEEMDELIGNTIKANELEKRLKALGPAQ